MTHSSLMSFSKQLLHRKRAHFATENSLRTQNKIALPATQIKPAQKLQYKQQQRNKPQPISRQPCVKDHVRTQRRQANAQNKRPTTSLKSRGGRCPPPPQNSFITHRTSATCLFLSIVYSSAYSFPCICITIVPQQVARGYYILHRLYLNTGGEVREMGRRRALLFFLDYNAARGHPRYPNPTLTPKTLTLQAL